MKVRTKIQGTWLALARKLKEGMLAAVITAGSYKKFVFVATDL